MNILLTSVGRRAYIVRYFKDALAGAGKVHATNSEYTYAMQIADKCAVSPLIFDDGYIDFLISYCKKNDIGAVVPLFDIDLPVMAQARESFAREGIQVVVSSPEVIEICNDKWHTYNFLKQNEISTPASFISRDDCLRALREGVISFPLIIKPRWGMGSIGVYQIESMEELEILLKRVRREIFTHYLQYESKQDAENCILIQEKLAGEEYGIDIFNDLHGNFLKAVPKKKISMRAGETDVAVIVNDQKLLSAGHILAQKLKHIANLDVDCFVANGTVQIVDMNARFGGQYPYVHLAGANFILALIKMLQGDKVPDHLLEAISGTVGIKDLQPKILLERHE